MKNRLRIILQLLKLLFTPKVFMGLVKSAIKFLLKNYREQGLPRWSREAVNRKETQEVKVGIVGGGSFAQFHLDVLNNLEGVRISAMCAHGSEKSKEVAKKYCISEYYSNIDSFLQEVDVDAYFVVLPILALKENAARCLERGRPVFIEKPAGLTSLEIKELIDVAHENDTFAMIGYNRRFFSVVQHGLAALASYGPIRGGVLEVPEGVFAHRLKNKFPSEVLDKWLFAQSSHAIDLFRYILGDVVQVKRMANFNDEIGNANASFLASIEFKSNVFGAIIGLWDTQLGWKMKIIAERGTLILDPLESAYLIDGNKHKLLIPKDSVDDKYRRGVFAEDHHFIQAVRKSRCPSMPACTLEEAYKTNSLIESLYGTSEESQPGMT